MILRGIQNQMQQFIPSFATDTQLEKYDKQI